MMKVCRANNDGHNLYRWEQDGVEWACCAYDHGPFCRRCQPVRDAVARELLDAVEAGFKEVYDTDSGWQFRLTGAGHADIQRRLR